MNYREVEIIINLQEKGYDHDFIWDMENIRCLQNDLLVSPGDFEILEIHHCSKKIRLNDSLTTIIYAVRLNNCEFRGILMSKYITVHTTPVIPISRKRNIFEKPTNLAYAY